VPIARRQCSALWDEHRRTSCTGRNAPRALLRVNAGRISCFLHHLFFSFLLSVLCVLKSGALMSTRCRAARARGGSTAPSSTRPPVSGTPALVLTRDVLTYQGVFDSSICLFYYCMRGYVSSVAPIHVVSTCTHSRTIHARNPLFRHSNGPAAAAAHSCPARAARRSGRAILYTFACAHIKLV
jgi:hypothetical protein